MALTDEQKRALRAKLKHRFVRTRQTPRGPMDYIEGWHAIAEANRIFGFDSWDRRTLLPNCVWSSMQQGQMHCFYTAKVQITVRAGPTVVLRDGVGTGYGTDRRADVAHDMALKAAETDATKRALATFGNPFGLALYDRTRMHVTKGPRPQKRQSRSNFILVKPSGAEVVFETAADFVTAFEACIKSLTSVDDVYEFWSANLPGLSQLNQNSEIQDCDPVAELIEQLKTQARNCKRDIRRNAPEETDRSEVRLIEQGSQSDAQSELRFPKEQRRRAPEHLRFVAQQPCAVCGRRPSHAHHLRFAQARAMARKVSDEFTVPLCSVHHDELHRTGDEQAWWARNGIIDPLKVAERLWLQSTAAKPVTHAPLARRYSACGSETDRPPLASGN
jgi:hypothetical protein